MGYLVRRLSGVILAAALLSAPPALAQAQGSRFEIGAQFAALRLDNLDATNAGLGGRLGYDLSPWLAIEGELNWFPNDRAEVRSSVADLNIRVAYSRRRFEGFAGPKIGLRRERFGVFGTVQPGFARLTDRGVNCLGADCARILFLLAQPDYRTEFAMNAGGVFELYPTPGIVARVDLGTTMIRHRSFAPPCGDCTSRNFSTRVGIGFRF